MYYRGAAEQITLRRCEVKKRRIEITIETEQVVLLHQRQESVTAWCPVCADSVQMLTLEEVAVLTSLHPQDFSDQAAGGQFHFTEIPEGQLWVCLNSVLNNPTLKLVKGEKL
jgi:hypothetical protein